MTTRLLFFGSWQPGKARFARLTVTRLAAAVALLLLALPLAEVQPAPKMPRIGALVGELREGSSAVSALRQGLHEFGYVEGQNIAIEWRSSQGKIERFPDFAAEMVRLKVDVIVAGSSSAIQAARQATRMIPIVMVFSPDPVGLGLVASLARPEGNITGLSSQVTDLAAKRLQLLREVVPNLSHVAVLWDPREPAHPHIVKEVEVAARALGLQVQLQEARSLSELDSAFASMTGKGASAVFVVSSSIAMIHRVRMAQHAARSRLPTMCTWHEYAEAGCLMSHSVAQADLWRRAAYFVDRILKGAKPAELPVEQPTKFELVINLKTAKALGVTIPPSLLLRADRLIE
jgi:putative ABC transport system substrate-binding protein